VSEARTRSSRFRLRKAPRAARKQSSARSGLPSTRWISPRLERKRWISTVRRHATWPFGWGIFTSVIFGFGSFLVALEVARDRGMSGLLNRGWHLLGVVAWLGGLW